MQAIMLRNKAVRLSTGETISPGHKHYEMLANFLRAPIMFAEDIWTRHVGQFGGVGWKNGSTGEVRYQANKPAGRTAGSAPDTTTKPPPQERAFQAAKQFVAKHRNRVKQMVDKAPVIGVVTRKTGQLVNGIKSTLAKRYGDRTANLIMASGSLGGYGVMLAAIKTVGFSIPGLTDAISIAAHVAVAEALYQAGVIGKNVVAHAEDDLADADITQLGKQAWQELGKRVTKMVAEHKAEIEKGVSEYKAKGQAPKQPETFAERAVDVPYVKLADGLWRRNPATGNLEGIIGPESSTFGPIRAVIEQAPLGTFSEIPPTCGSSSCTCSKPEPTEFAERPTCVGSDACVSCNCDGSKENQSGHESTCPCNRAWELWNYKPASEPAPDTGTQLARLSEAPEYQVQSMPQLPVSSDLA